MKVLFKFIVVIAVLLLVDHAYGQSSGNADNAGKVMGIYEIERPSLEAEQNMQLQIQLFNSIMHNKYSNYSKANNNSAFESPITFTEDLDGYEVSEFPILDNPWHSFDKNRNAHIPGSRYYERPDTERYNPAYLDPWSMCPADSFSPSPLRVKVKKEKGLPR